MAWRIVFAIAALFNAGVGLSLLPAPERAAAAFGQAAQENYLVVRLAGALIAVFGLGYAMAAADPGRSRNLIWLGMIGKLGAVVLAGAYFRAGLVAQNVFTLSLGDLVFVVLFALFLFRGRGGAPA